MSSEIKEYVKRRYGEIAESGGSCCPSCSCDSGSDVALRIGYSEEDMESIPSGSSMGLGCGNPVALADLREGEVVVDLGSGGGVDVFLAAKKVGPSGRVIGVDMTKEMVSKARAAASGHCYGNVEFRLGEIENLPLKDLSVDVIISNCVINLSPDKEKVFREAYRVLKPGGRIMVSDIVTEGKLPEDVRSSLQAWAGCVAGALEKERYLEAMRRTGFKRVRIVSQSTYDTDISRELGGKLKSVQVEAQKK